MEISELKNQIGKNCLAKDPRSKKRVFKNATIMAVKVNIQNYARHGEGKKEIRVHVSYDVRMHDLTKSNNKRREEYHRTFTVSGDNIEIL